VTTDTITVERLCEHHEPESFDCGDSTLNEQLKYFRKGFADGDRVLGFVATPDGRSVFAYVILAEAILEVRGTESKELRVLTVPAIAVHKDHRGGNIFRALVKKALEVMARRQDEALELGLPYHGVVCLPGDNAVLERWLIDWVGFEPITTGLVSLPLLEEDGSPRPSP